MQPDRLMAKDGEMDTGTPIGRTGAADRRRQALTPPRARRTPVVWAAVGAVFLLAEIWVLARWVLDGGARTVPAHGELSTARQTMLWVWQALVLAALAATAWYAVRTSRREKRPSAFAVLFVGFLTSAWLDPLTNYRDPTLVFTAHVLNISTWGPYIPGWHGPLPESAVQTLAASNGLYFGLFVWWPYLTFLLLDRVMLYRPDQGVLKPAAAATAISSILVAALGPVCTYVSGHAWYSTTGLALFAGHWYQQPLYGIVPAALIAGAPGAVMLYRARHDGMDIPVLRGSQRPLVRLLAGIGFTQLTILAYCIALIVAVSLNPGPPPADTPGFLNPHPPG